MSTVVIALAWGALAGLTVARVAGRAVVAVRLRAVRPRARAGRPAGPRRLAAHLHARWRDRLRHPGLRVVGRVAGAPVRLARERRRREAVLAEVPVVVDLVGVAVAAGCTPYRAVAVAARWSPPRVAPVLERVVQVADLGAGFGRALRVAGRAVPELHALTEALRVSSELGSPAGPALARVAAEVRADVRRRAEARARTVPVRLLFPLVFCVLPAFVLLTVVPALLAGTTR
ncbi:MAG: hypothetical protein KatS3mg009_0730 [Acidimicrobiia bacterium]|nr:MAG: hypothetical protein KatS3mg009_0730 [Acidimicrobiia bacterium]